MRTGFILLLVAVLLFGWTVPCYAAKAPAGGEGDPTAGHGHDGPRPMFERALDLGIWTLVIFLLLLFILSRYAWKPMLEGLEKREQDIAQAKQDADAARAEAAKAREELQAEIEKGHEKVREMFEEARRKGEENAAEMEAKAQKKIEEDRERLLRDIETARTQALHDIWGQTSQVASLAAGKILKKEINADDQNQLVDEALAEFQESLSERQRQMAGLKA